MHGAMTNSFLHNGTVFPNKSPILKSNMHELESTNQLSTTVNHLVGSHEIFSKLYHFCSAHGLILALMVKFVCQLYTHAHTHIIGAREPEQVPHWREIS